MHADLSSNMYSTLVDQLMRPTTSLTNQNCLEYVYRPNCAIDHIVLGDGPIGGSWNAYDSDMSIISMANWMSLPGYSIEEWANNQTLPTRLKSGLVRDYFRAYVKQMGLEKNFMEHTTVTNVSVSLLQSLV